MNILNTLVMTLAALSVGAYLCRLDALHVRTHKLKVILLHVALMASAGASGFSAFEGTLSLQDIAGLAASVMWLWVSIPSWRYGPPDHVSKPMPLELLDWPSVHGGVDD